LPVLQVADKNVLVPVTPSLAPLDASMVLHLPSFSAELSGFEGTRIDLSGKTSTTAGASQLDKSGYQFLEH